MKILRVAVTLVLVLPLWLVGLASATADVENYTDAVNSWFEQQAPGVVLAQGDSAFPEASNVDIQHYTIGAPHSVSVLTKENNEIFASDRWVAVLSHGVDLVGIVSAKIDAEGDASAPLVLGDTRLATEVDIVEAQDELIYDEALDVWFTLRNESIEPADVAATEVVLGAIPVDQFLDQRALNLGEAKPEATETEVMPIVLDDDGPSVLVTALVIAVMITVVTLSLLWLRWETQRQPRATQTRVVVGKRALPAGAERSRNDAFDAPHVIEKPTADRKTNESVVAEDLSPAPSNTQALSQAEPGSEDIS